MLELILCVALVTQVEVLTVRALEKVAYDRLLPTVVTSDSVMCHSSVHILGLALLLEFESWKDGSAALLGRLQSSLLHCVVWQGFLNDEQYMIRLVSQVLVYAFLAEVCIT